MMHIKLAKLRLWMPQIHQVFMRLIYLFVEWKNVPVFLNVYWEFPFVIACF